MFITKQRLKFYNKSKQNKIYLFEQKFRVNVK